MKIESTLFFTVLVCAALCVGAIPERVYAQERGARNHIEGTVADEKGNPIAGALVALGPVPSLFERERNDYAKTNASGTFKLDVAYPGNATVSCWHPDYIGTVQGAATDSPTAVVLRPGNVLEGAVDIADDMKGEIMVSAYFPEAQYQEYARGGRDGSFRFGNLPAGLCEIEVRTENGSGTTRVVLREEVNVRAGTSNRADLAPVAATASLRGTVKDGTRATVSAKLTVHITTQGGTHIESIQSAGGGDFSFSALPPGEGHLVIAARDKASIVRPVKIDNAVVMEPVELEEAQSLRCSLLNAPEGTTAAQLLLFPGKIERPGAQLADVRALFDQPAAWTDVVRGKTTDIKVLATGPYTLLAYPLASAIAEYSIFEVAEQLRLMPVYMDSFTAREGGAGVVVAAAFPADARAAYAAAQQPLHPVIGSWAYQYKGSVWTRTFTPEGYCILTEGPVTAWRHPYIILGERRVAVIIDGAQRIHTVNKNGTLDVEGQFTASRM